MSTTFAHLRRAASAPSPQPPRRSPHRRRLLGILLSLCGVAALLPEGRGGAWPPDERAGAVDYSDPKNWPSDSSFKNQWESWSFAPKEFTKLDARTRRLGMGASYDRAWAKTQGDPRVVISVLDSGAYWDERDLVNKWFLNQAELPPPDDACQKPENRGEGKRRHDANGDGVFNVQDYTTVSGHEQPEAAKICDPRLRDQNGNGILDPQDLIVAFSDKKDDDRNGYIDDIAGWDFFRNDNDAYDDTRYGHGTGEAKDSSAEADNGRAEAGVCPRCRVMPLRVGDSFVADSNDFAVATVYAVDIGASVVQEALGTIDNTPLSRWAIDYAYDNHVAVIASAADENSYHHNFPGTNNHTIYVHAIRPNAEEPRDATHAFAFDNCTNYGAQLLLSVPGESCSSEATGRSSGMAGLIYSAALAADLPAPPRLHPPTAGDTAPAGDGGPAASRVRRLSAEEVRQIMVGTADSFYDPSEDNNLGAYPTGPGFVRRFGYGRVNARSAVDNILSGAIPAEVEIEKPEWFQVFGERDGTVPIEGRIAIRHGKPEGDSFDFEVAWAPGVDPRDERFMRLGHGEMLSQTLEGKLADLPVAQIKVQNPVLPVDDPAWQPDDRAHIYTITVRVRVLQRSADPRRNGLRSEARRAVHIHTDPDLLPGFPKRLGASGEASLKTADLNGDGRREIIVADAGGLVHALRADGTELPGFPVSVPNIAALAATPAGHTTAPGWSQPAAANRPRPGYGAAITATPAIGDITGDGKPEIVVATYDGHVVAIGADGKILPGFPVELERVAALVARDRRHVIDDGFFASPVLADLDHDGRLDIIAAGMDSQVYVWRGDGTSLPGWPFLLWDAERPDDDRGEEPRQRQRIMGTPAVGDVNGDGVLDIVVGTNEQYGDNGRVYVLDGRGSKAPKAILPGWPVTTFSRYVLPVVGSGMPNAAALADIDKDGKLEIFVNGIGSNLDILRSDGSSYPIKLQPGKAGFGSQSDTSEFAALGFIASPAIGDIDGDGRPEALLPNTGANTALSMLKGYERMDYEMLLSVWDVASGKQLDGFPRSLEDYVFFQNPIVADVDGDGRREAVAASAGYFVHAWNADGKEARGFPKFTGGWVAAAPAVGDLDGDGRLEMVASTRNGWLFAWHTRGKARGRIDWDSFHHDNRNTGNYAEPLDQGGDEFDPPEPTDMTPVAGCSCSVGRGGLSRGEGGLTTSASEPTTTVFALLVLGFYMWQRRRLLS